MTYLELVDQDKDGNEHECEHDKIICCDWQSTNFIEYCS